MMLLIHFIKSIMSESQALLGNRNKFKRKQNRESGISRDYLVPPSFHLFRDERQEDKRKDDAFTRNIVRVRVQASCAVVIRPLSHFFRVTKSNQTPAIAKSRV